MMVNEGKRSKARKAVEDVSIHLFPMGKGKRFAVCMVRPISKGGFLGKAFEHGRKRGGC